MSILKLRDKITLITFGLCCAFAAIELFMQLSGLILARSHLSPNNHMTLKKNTRILCLGDSFTYGIGVAKEESYPGQLQEILNKLNTKTNYTVINKGFPGINSSLLLSDFEKNLNETSPDIVIILIGCNDHGIFKGIDSGFQIKTIQLLKNILSVVIKKIPLKQNSISRNSTKIFLQTEKTASPDSFIKKNPQDDISRLIFLGNLHRSKDEYDKSFEYYNLALKTDPLNAAAKLELLRALKLAQQFPEAINLAFEIINYSQTKTEVYIELANIFQIISNGWQFIYLCNQVSEANMQDYSNLPNNNLKIIKTSRPEYTVLRKKKILQNLLETASTYYCLKSYNNAFDYFREVYNLFQRVCLIDKYTFTACPEAVKYELLTIFRHEIGDCVIYKNLTDIALICQKKNLRLILLSYPEYLPYSVKKVSLEHSIELFDIREEFKKQTSTGTQSKYFLENDSHCSALGNSLIARYIARKLTQPSEK
ncbi:MAG: hypothetical protein HY810_05655 [Candidatus Omnitrophica bacterium]|nr:hypothetical protein [Candidatus Omnitrophota bacterium]